MKTVIFIILVSSIACNSTQSNPVQTDTVKSERLIQVESIINDSIINSDDVQAIIDPLWWTVDIYQTYDIYVESLKDFSENQKFVFAIQWYQAEVNNGGHAQFFYNSTGIVWKDVIDGFEKIRLSKYHTIIKEAINRFSKKPAFDRDQRISQLESRHISFDDLDSRFYKLDKITPLQAELIRFIKTNRTDFYFRGLIRRPANYP